MIKYKHGFLLRDVVIVALLFCGVIALLMIMIVSVSNNYNRPDIVSQQFSNSFNKLNQLTTGTNGIQTTQNSMTNTTLSFLGNFDVALSSTWTVFNLGWASLDIFSNMNSGLIQNFPFLDQATIYVLLGILISLLTVIIIFTIISSVTRGRL